MKTTSQLIVEIQDKINELSMNGIHSLYMFSIRVTNEVATNVRNHFESLGYDIEVKVCPRKNLDIIVRF